MSNQGLKCCKCGRSEEETRLVRPARDIEPCICIKCLEELTGKNVKETEKYRYKVHADGFPASYKLPIEVEFVPVVRVGKSDMYWGIESAPEKDLKEWEGLPK